MFDLLFLVLALVVTYVTGSIIESRHFASLTDRENKIPLIPVISNSDLQSLGTVEDLLMLSANVVIGADFFKHKLSLLVNLFGGNISTLERVLVRARREAFVRLRQAAYDKGADALVDVRYETSMLNDKGTNALPMVEIFVYGTAVRMQRQ